MSLKKNIKKMLIVFLFLMVVWTFGLILFIHHIPKTLNDSKTSTDAIVVLTGGPCRINAGISLLKEGAAHFLFISGVNPLESLDSLLRIQQGEGGCLLHSEVKKDRISLGFKARTTVGNALETAQWVQDNHITSIRLVTSALHMNRSLLVFDRINPTLKIIPHPIFEKGQSNRLDLIPENASFLTIFKNFQTLLFVAREYNKYLFAICHLQEIFRRNIHDV